MSDTIECNKKFTGFLDITAASFMSLAVFCYHKQGYYECCIIIYWYKRDDIIIIIIILSDFDFGILVLICMFK